MEIECKLIKEKGTWSIVVDDLGINRELEDETTFMQIREDIEGELIANGEEVE